MDFDDYGPSPIQHSSFDGAVPMGFALHSVVMGSKHGRDPLT